MRRAAVERIIDRVRTDQDWYRHLYSAEPTARPLLEMWRDSTGRKRRDVVSNTAAVARDLLNALENGNGIYHFRFHYWHGGLEMSRQAMWINAVLSSPEASAGERQSVKQAAVLFANILFDDVFRTALRRQH